jgi:hypothetical protein
MPKRSHGNVRTHQRETHEQVYRSPRGDTHTVRHTTEAGAAFGPEGALVGAGVGTAYKGGKAANRAARNAATAPVQAVTSHTHGGVLFWSLLLLVMATWSGFWKPTINVIWDPVHNDWNTTITKRTELGGVAFCILISFIANYNDDAGAVIELMLVALWLIFIMFQGTGTIKNTFNWFQGGTGNAPQQQNQGHGAVVLAAGPCTTYADGTVICSGDFGQGTVPTPKPGQVVSKQGKCTTYADGTTLCS